MFLNYQLLYLQKNEIQYYLLKILESKGIYLSVRSNSLRITPHLWNTHEELDFMIEQAEERTREMRKR